MSIEVTLHPTRATRKELSELLVSLRFTPTEHLWDWPRGSLHYYWFEDTDFQSFDGVEATIYPPSVEQQDSLGECDWALHTRTRAFASPADQEHQNKVIRAARQRFGGSFFNDWYGRNRYTKVEPDPREPAARGIYLAHGVIQHNISAIRFALPKPLKQPEGLPKRTKEAFGQLDPTRVLYNALVPFAVAILEYFFGQSFRIMLRYDEQAQKRLRELRKKVDLSEVLAIQAGERSIEDIIADSYSFQNIASIDKAFSEWFGIKLWSLLRKRRKVGKRLPILEKRFSDLIEFRHGIIHRLHVSFELRRSEVDEIFDLARVIVDTFVDHLERERGMVIRD